jgi:hypothetical protein
MVVGQHKLSRRALLGAALAPALIRRSGLDPEPKTTADQSTSSPARPQDRWIHDRDPSGTVRGAVPPDHQVRDDEA